MTAPANSTLNLGYYKIIEAVLQPLQYLNSTATVAVVTVWDSPCTDVLTAFPFKVPMLKKKK